MLDKRNTIMGAALAAFALAGPAAAQVGVTDDAIKIGNIMPYSGPASAYGQIGETMEAYFDKVNAEGGINGRMVEFITYDDAYSPPKTVEQTRRLVEQDQVSLLFGTLGTPTNTAIHRYVNAKGVPHLFLATGASKWGQPEEYPWTMGWQPNYPTEGKIYAQYIMDNIPDAKIGILYQNDDYGKDYLHGFMDGLGDKAEELVVAEESYEVADPTVDSQIINLQASGANVFFNITTPKFAAQAIKKAHEIGWEPTHFLNNVSQSVGAVLKPAGLEASQGIISAIYQMEPGDPQWSDHPEMVAWNAFMDEYYPDGDKTSSFTTFGYASAKTMEQVLIQAGDDLSRENIMAEAANLNQVRIPILLPGILVDTSPTDFYPIEAVQLVKFEGESWERFGEVLSSESE
jgi:branched-chain amino acid transport system substrate-binding protein